MEKSFSEQMRVTYHQEGDYLLPNLMPPKSVLVGIWGQRRRRYLQTHRQPIYTALFLSGELDSHLSEIDQQAEEMFSQLVKQLAEQDGVTEQLKAERQMEWVGRMNNICNRAAEIITAELIFVCGPFYAFYRLFAWCINMRAKCNFWRTIPVLMLMRGKASQENFVELTAAQLFPITF